MEKRFEFWAGIWEKEGKTPEMPWMEKVKMELREKVQNVNKSTITDNKVAAEIRNRKNWTTPGIDGIQNYWWKIFQTAQKALTRAFERMKNDYDMIQFGGQQEEQSKYLRQKTLAMSRNIVQ